MTAPIYGICIEQEEIVLSRRFVAAIAGFFMMLFVGIFYAWSLFRLRLIVVFPTWTAADCSLTFTIFIMCFCAAGILGGKFSALWGRRKTLYISAALILAGGLLFTSIQTMNASSALLVTYLSYGVLCGVGAGIAYNVIISGVSLLFPKRAGLASGILLTGFGFGSLFLGIVMEEISDAIGFFPTFRWSAILIAALLFGGSFTFRAKEAPLAQQSSLEEDGLPPSQVLKTPKFWLYLFWVIFMSSAGLTVINSASAIAAYFGAFAALGMIVSLFNGFSRIAIGSFCDHFGSKKSIFVNNCCAIIAGVFLLLSALMRSTPLMFLGLIIAGVSYGSTMALNASVTKELFGRKYYSMNFSLITLSGIPASFMGPYVSGVLQDRSQGAYTTTFLAMIVFALISLILYLFFCRSLSTKETTRR